ncbi:hypothetical protein ES707_07320 [subsurface metagenome]
MGQALGDGQTYNPGADDHNIYSIHELPDVIGVVIDNLDCLLHQVLTAAVGERGKEIVAWILDQVDHGLQLG